MLARIHHITFDCRDPHRLGRFWSEVLGFVEDPDDPNLPHDTEVMVVDPRGLHPGLLFVTVPEDKVVKNRVHLDLWPAAARDLTIEPVLALGGTIVADRREPDGTGWVTLADPEGNELCIVRSAAERGVPAPVDTGRRPQRHLFEADERAMLTGMLDWYREGVLAKVEGVSALLARAQPLRSPTSIIGLVKHLALVEDSWFVEDLEGRPIPEPWQGIDWDADPDWEFRSALDDDLDHVVGLYRAAIERSREITARHDLDDRTAGPAVGCTLRYILLHMIEETARHLGHLDVLRELADGTTGD